MTATVIGIALHLCVITPVLWMTQAFNGHVEVQL